MRFAGVAGGSRAGKNAHSSSLIRASSAAHLMLCSWVRILGAPIFKMGENLTFEYSLQESRRLSRWVLCVWPGWSSFFCASWLAMADVGIGAISAPVVGVAQETEGAGSVVATPARKVKNCGQCNFPKVMACICVLISHYRVG